MFVFEIVFRDPRRFGGVWTFDCPDTLYAARWSNLGPDALTIKPMELHRRLRGTQRAVKAAMLDQTLVAGLGNIYVDEALHASGLHPLARSDKLTRAAARDLHAAIRETLAAAIEREGSSFDVFYRTPEGQPGSYQHQFRVYGRTGQPCGGCGEPIQRIVVAQRGTHLCRRCQPRRGRRRVYSAAP